MSRPLNLAHQTGTSTRSSWNSVVGRAPARIPPTVRPGPTVRFKTDDDFSMDTGMPMASDIDVAILGAGPAGLAVALGIQRALPGVRLKVFDKATNLRPIGAAVTIAANGQSALEALSARGLEALREKALSVIGWQSRNHLGEILHEGPITQMSSIPGQGGRVVEPIIVSWFSLQACLLDTLGREHLVLNKAVTDVQQQEDGTVTLTFQDGSQTTTHVAVGADGNMSATRAALFPEEGPPEYSGGATWRTMISPVPEGLGLPVGWLAMWNSEEGPARRVGIRNFGDHLSVTGIAPWAKERLQELWRKTYYGEEEKTTDAAARQDNKRKRLADCLSAALPANVVSLLVNADPATLIEHGMYYRDAEKPWVHGSVALVGDAAHVMPPPLGQGTSLAFEDAAWLVVKLSEALESEAQASGTSALSVLREPGSARVISAGLKAYQAQQQPRVALIGRRTLKAEGTNSVPVAPEQEEEDNKVLNGMPLSAYIQGAGPFPVLAEPDATVVVSARRGDKVPQAV